MIRVVSQCLPGVSLPRAKSHRPPFDRSMPAPHAAPVRPPLRNVRAQSALPVPVKNESDCDPSWVLRGLTSAMSRPASSGPRRGISAGRCTAGDAPLALALASRDEHSRERPGKLTCHGLRAHAALLVFRPRGPAVPSATRSGRERGEIDWAGVFTLDAFWRAARVRASDCGANGPCPRMRRAGACFMRSNEIGRGPHGDRGAAWRSASRKMPW